MAAGWENGENALAQGLQLPPRALISTPSRVCGRYRGFRPDLYVLNVELPEAYSLYVEDSET